MVRGYRSLLPLALLASCASPARTHVLEGAVYNVEGRDAPEGVSPEYVRGAYLHPVSTPSGRIVTGDYPPSHRHQHGVSFPWTRTLVEGRPVDFWNTGAGQGTLRTAGVSAVPGGLLAEHEFVDLTAPGGALVVMTERWEVLVERRPRAVVIDLVSTQRATGAPVEVLEYHYGGFTVRGALAWEDGCQVLTSEGSARAAADGERVRWCALYGPLEDGQVASLAVLAHPSNLRAPQPVRVHPEVPYFCFAPCRLGAFTIERDTPLVSRYRVLACDGPPDPALLDALWAEFSAPR